MGTFTSLTFLALCATIATVHAGCHYTFENADCAGHDVFHAKLNRAACRAACTRRADCKSFQQRGKNCWLKNHVCSRKELSNVGHKSFAQFTKHCRVAKKRVYRKVYHPKKHIRPHTSHRRCGGIVFRVGKLFRKTLFRTLKRCPPGSRPHGRSFCRVINLGAFMNWSRRFGPRFGFRFGGVRLFRNKGKHPARIRPKITFYLRGKRYIFKQHRVYQKIFFRYRRNKHNLRGVCLPGSRNFPNRKRVANCKIFNIGIFRKFLLKHGRRLFHLQFVRFKFGKHLKRNFRPGGWLNLRWFHNLKHCPSGTRRHGRRCKILRFPRYRTWLKRFGPRYGITRRRFKWLRGRRFRFYKLLRRNMKKGGLLRLKWFRGLKRCPRGTKKHGHRCRIVKLKFFRRWLRRHAHRFHINLKHFPKVPTLIHYFKFSGRSRPRWRIKRRGGVRFIKKKFLYLPGKKGSTATFRPIRFRGSFTISFYVKPMRVKGRQTLIGSWVKRRWLYKLHLVNGRLGAWLRRGPRPGLNLATIHRAGKLAPKRWYHVALRWNARTRFLRIFLNGKLVGSKKSKFPRTVKLFPKPGRTAIGFKQDSKNENFHGYIAGLRINRGAVPRKRFIMLTRRIKKFKLHFGGFKYIKSLRRNLRRGGKIFLRWFIRHGKKALRKCPPGTRRVKAHRKHGPACRVHHSGNFYKWLIRRGPRFGINLSRLPRPHVYRFAPGNKLLRLFRGFHARGGTPIKGLFTSGRCRNWCARVRWCRAVDYNGQTRRCYYHRKPFRRIRATRKSSGVKQVWKIAQYARKTHHGKRPVIGFTHRFGDCPGHDIGHFKRTNLKFCTKQCRRRANCKSFVFVARGRNSFCYLKKSRCRHLKATRNRSYHFYTKRGGFRFWKLLRRNFKKGGVIHLKWFKRRKCMHGTKRVGKTGRCRVVHLRFFRKWLRKHAKRYRINLRRFPRVPHLYHLYLFTGKKHRKPKWRIIRRGGVKYSKRRSLYFPGRRGSFALGKRFPKHRHSFTISFYVKPATVAHTQTLIGQWGPKRWQYLFRILKGGRLGLWLRRNKFNTGSDPRQDMVSVASLRKVAPKRWNHVGFSWHHSTGVAKIYINGKLAGKAKTRYPDHDLFAKPDPWFQLGYKKDTNNENFKGKIAGLRFTRGIIPLRRFRLFFKRVPKGKLHFGGFKFQKKLHKVLRFGGRIDLRWFKHKNKVPKKCPKGSHKSRGRAAWDKYICRIVNLHHIYRWIRRIAPRYRINIRKLPKVRVYHFAPGKGQMRFYRQQHSMGGKVVRGRFNSAKCRNYCAARKHCKAVDYNGATRQCFIHTKYRPLRPATRKSTGTPFYWKVGQYRKVGRHPARAHVRGYSHRFGDCPGSRHNLKHYKRVGRKFCINKCNRNKRCRSLIFVARGSASYCFLKRSYCRRLVSRKHKNYHFYTKIVRRFPHGPIFRKQIKKGGIIHLKWFRGLRRCMRGTKRVGKTKTCRVVKPRFVFRWVRKHHKVYHFNLSRFTRIPRTYHVFYFNRRRKPNRWRIVRRRGVVVKRKKALYFPGKKGAYATGPRFNKYRGSFTISFFVKPKTVSRNQVLIANWAPRRWQYLFRILKGGNLGLYLRGPSANRDIVRPLRGGKLLPNRWYYVGFSWNRHTGVAKIYVNGKVVKSGKGKPGNLFGNPYPRFQLGYKKDSNNENFCGLIANLRFTRNIMPRRRFIRFTKLIKGLKLHFGGFKFTKPLHKALHLRGVFPLKWFRHGKHVKKKCPRGSRRIGKGKKNIKCRIYRLRWIYKWLRKHGPTYRINVARLPRVRFYKFAPGNKIMKFYRQYHSIGGKQLRGRFTSRSCRNHCQKTACWAVDYNGATKKCYIHRKPKRRVTATAKSTGTKFYWKVGQYVKRRFTPPAHYHLRRYRHRHGDCPGHDLHHITRTNLKVCSHWCNRHPACRSFLYVDRGSNSYCWLKRHAKACIGRLKSRKRRNHHFYNKKAPRKVTIHWRKLLRPQLKKGGVIHLNWFKNLKKCMWGTKAAGKTCKIVNYPHFIRWIRRFHRRYHINLAHFPRIHRLYHTFVFRKARVPKKFKLIRHPGVTYIRIPAKKPKVFALNFPGKKGAFATGPRFNKYKSSFTIAFYIKPRTVSHNQVLIANWAPHRWQYLFRIWKGGKLGLFLRGPTQNRDIVPELRGGKVVPNKWSHVGFSFNRHTGVARIYLNGKVVATKTTKIKYPQRHLFKSPFPRFQLGYKMDSHNEFYNGLMANLQFYRGVAPKRVFVRFTKFIKKNKLNFSGFPKKTFHLLLKQVRPGGIIHLSWFKRKHCFPGTKRVGKTCRINRIRFFLKWLRRVAPKFRINIGKLPMNKVWPLRPAGKIYGHPWYLLFRQPRPKTSKGIKKGKGPFGSRQPGYYFPGKPNGFFKIPNHGHLHFKSFTIFAWIKQNGVRNGPIVEYAGHKNVHFGTHFWIWGNTLFVNVVHNHGKMFGVHFPKFKGMFPKNKWAFVGVSYNHKNGHILMWINGRTYFKQGPRATPDTVGPVYVGIRPKGPREHPFKGYISGVSILPFAITRKNVRKFSRYYIKLIGGKAPAGFFKPPGKPKPKPHKPYSLLPAGKIFKHNYYNCFGFIQKKFNPKKSVGPFHSTLPSYYFPGKPNVYFKVPSGGKLNFKSITIFTFIKQTKLHDGAILEWGGAKGKRIGTHFWIWQKKLFVNLRHNNGKSLSVFFNIKGGIPVGKWNFVGMSYDHGTGVVMMWINGNIYTKKVGKFTLDTVGDAYVGVRPSDKKFHPFKGYLSGVTLLPFAISPAQIAPFRMVILRRIYHIKSLPRGLRKKLTKLGKKFPQVLKWIKSIINHLYWCAVTSDNNKELILAKWKSIANHVANTHKHDSVLFPKCVHKRLGKGRQWFKTSSEEYDKLCSILLNAKFLKSVGKLSSNGQTSGLEGYHSLVIHFAPKMYHFGYNGMKSRLQMAALHFNENAGREQASNKDGSARFNMRNPKNRHGDFIVATVASTVTFDFWWKVGYKPPQPKPVVPGKGGESAKEKPEPTTVVKPKAPTTLTKENLRPGGRFDLRSVFKGLATCPKGTKSEGDYCVITDYKIFISWLKIHAATYHIVFSSLPLYTTTTTTTTTQFSAGQKFPIEMFRNVCPKGTKTVGKFCEITSTELFLAWLKVNAKAYGIQYNYSEGGAGGGSTGGGGYTTETHTTTSTSGGGFAVGQSFPNAMFGGKCPTGTAAKAANCVVNNATSFMGWLKVNGAKYGISFSTSKK